MDQIRQHEPSTAATQNIRDVLKSADIEALRKELAELEAFASSETKRLREEVDTMRALVRFAERLKFGHLIQAAKTPREKPAKVKPDGIAGRPVTMTLQDRAKVYLEAAGPATIQAIARGLDYENTSYLNSRLMDDDRFTKNDRGLWTIRS